MARYACTTSNYIPAGDGRPSAHELFSGRKPDASHLRTMLCRAYILDHDRESKLAERATPGVLVGLGPEPGNYLVRLDRNGETIMTRSLFLLESTFPLLGGMAPFRARGLAVWRGRRRRRRRRLSGRVWHGRRRRRAAVVGALAGLVMWLVAGLAGVGGRAGASRG
jgi:hypothetical protein